ncbi:Piso0_001926 [Millerozyma farinosa CBS 7064]|uniref:Piso0_001926 protein n=1 Tax=Pichia sorbitophila (strain ATCC MYA-4447 / BCRC 22081 / CBS 7064 / NBRC 10061 / NRRL Y-12695) TaxID=559304 RepID=G8YM25_PICSO|nr:Piso0_001926 [Millerozyma farinosa CBS 7064]
MKYSGSYSLRLLLLYFFFTLEVVNANLVKFDVRKSSVCSGVYSKKDWGGRFVPNIEFVLEQFGSKKYDHKGGNSGDDDHISMTYVVFEYKDLDKLGYPLSNGDRKYICDDDAIKSGYCKEDEKWSVIVNSKTSNSTIKTGDLKHLGPAKLEYNVKNTGLYCLYTASRFDDKYRGLVNFQNAFGYLSGSDIPKLPAYGILTICYAMVLALYGFQFYKKRNQNQILPLQRYLLGMLGVLTFDSLVVWSYYDLVNRTKNPSSGFVTFYMLFLSLMNSIKTTFSFFILLCIALGYGVVLLKLKKSVMLKCKILAGAHFAATMLYLVATYYSGGSGIGSGSDLSDDSSGTGVKDLFPIIPVAITLTVYYISILTSIRQTTVSLNKQRQVIKLQLYRKLFFIIFFSVVMTFAGLVLSTFAYLSMSTTQAIEEDWKSAFFVFDFWPSVVFFFAFLGVAWLWRPTETSYMLAVSQQVSTGEGQDDDLEDHVNAEPGYHQGREFELDDLSLISHSDNENQGQDRNSFELHESHNDGVATKGKNSSTNFSPENTPEAGNTLFELGDESDDEHKHDDRLHAKDD